MLSRYGEQNGNYKHGMCGTRIYRTYNHMKDRCVSSTNKDYRFYGGRGITVCDEWLGENGFINFCSWALSNGYADNLTLDRKDSDGNYEPSNCRWITIQEQQRNRRDNIKYTYNGETLCLSEWARRYGIKVETLRKRLLTKDFEEAIAFSRERRDVTIGKCKKLLDDGNSIYQIAKKLSCSVKTVNNRLKEGD